MDRLAVTVSFFFFVVFSSTTSIALGVIDKTDSNVIIERDLPRTFPDPDTKSPRTILLPTGEGSESEHATVAEWERMDKIPESDDAAAVESSSKPETESVPLTIISFHPIQRRFRSPGRMMIPRRHRCRHHQQLMKPWGTGFRDREVSYGDDMLVSNFKGVGPDPTFRGGVRQIPARWARFHQEGNRFPHLRKDRMSWANLHGDEKREEKEENHEEEDHHHHERLRGTHLRGYENRAEKEENHEEEHHHRHEKSWFTGTVRKFLNQF